MPQFYFHVALRGDLFEDRDGWHYADVEGAKAYARRLALDLRGTGNFMAAVVMVVDEFGREEARVPVDRLLAFACDPDAPALPSDARKAEPAVKGGRRSGQADIRGLAQRRE